MKNITKKLSALALGALFATMQVSASIDTGLGGTNGGAVIDKITGGYDSMTGVGTGNVNLNFNGSSHVNWNTLNVDKGQSLNFNAVNGANGITVLNTVNTGMSTIAGQINSNSGIGKLIISNPNGVLFDGASFTASGDVMLTTQPYTSIFKSGEMKPVQIFTNNSNAVIKLRDSDFKVGGEFNIIAPNMSVIRSAIKTDKGLKLVTDNGKDYLTNNNIVNKNNNTVNLQAVNIDGNVYILSNGGIVKTTAGGTIKGDLNIENKNGSVAMNYVSDGKVFHVTGDVNAVGNGTYVYARNTKVDGNLSLENGGGFLEVGNVQVGKDMTLKTTQVSENPEGYKHFVHVIGNTKVGGNATIDSVNNIHIGNYDIDQKKLLEGKFTVGGDLTAHADQGHVMVTVDTTADKISLKSDNYNILSDGKAKLTANEYKFSSNGYIGSLKGTENYTTDEVIIATMEGYKYIPLTVSNPEYINIGGGEIKKVDTPEGASAYIRSYGDLKVTGANTGNLHITAPDKYIEITGKDVHANTVYVGKETDKLKVDFPSRNYKLKYTNIRDEQETVVNGDEEITYELTNGENGYNTKENRAEDTTYLVGPDKPVVPPVEPDPEPDPEPAPVVDDNNENVKVLRSFVKPEALDKVQPNTPIAYAADLDDDKVDTGVRKNVDGSVTVVRAFPMIN